MDNNINLQVKKLIEVDNKAVELETRKKQELIQLEEDYRRDAERIDKQLLETREEAKRTYEKLLLQAREEAEALSISETKSTDKIVYSISQDIESITMELWQKILDDLKS